jgi:glycosyltransferase involved in cell wall biosynthesis
VEAARNIKKQYSNIRFKILGFLDQRNPSAIPPETVTNWHQEGIIEYLGSADNVKEVILGSDCVVLPSSYREGIPRSLLEAASLEKPVIASDVPGCRDVVVNELTGYLCKPMNVMDLQKKMEKMLLTSPDERIKMGKAGREKIKNQFAMKVILRQYQKSVQGQ